SSHRLAADARRDLVGGAASTLILSAIRGLLRRSGCCGLWRGAMPFSPTLVRAQPVPAGIACECGCCAKSRAGARSGKTSLAPLKKGKKKRLKKNLDG